MDEAIIQRLKDYFAGRDDVSLAFLFGSQVAGTAGVESDTDIAIYFQPTGQALEWEENQEYPATDEIWSAIAKIVPTATTDMVVLNRAPAMLAADIIQNGLPLAIKDPSLGWRLFLAVTDAAEEFRQIKADWRAIAARSQSITYFDSERLLDRLEFMATELSDLPQFQNLSRQEYQTDRNRRRNVERWVENIVNASIDIAKTLLASEKKRAPMKYEEILLALGELNSFPLSAAETMANFAKTRNWLAHEYLDMSFDRISKFIQIADQTYPQLITFARQKLAASQKK